MNVRIRKGIPGNWKNYFTTLSNLWYSRDNKRAAFGGRLLRYLTRRLSQLPDGRLCYRVQPVWEGAFSWNTDRSYEHTHASGTKFQVLEPPHIIDTDTQQTAVLYISLNKQSFKLNWLLGVGLMLARLWKLSVSTVGLFSVTSTLDGDLEGESPENTHTNTQTI